MAEPKSFCTYEQQLQILKNRGLSVPDESLALRGQNKSPLSCSQPRGPLPTAQTRQKKSRRYHAEHGAAPAAPFVV